MKILAIRSRFGAFTYIDLLIVILTAALWVMLLPALLHSRGSKCKATRVDCVNRLKQIGLAHRIWANDHEDKSPWQVSVSDGGTREILPSQMFQHFAVMSNELATPRTLICQNDKKRQAATNFATLQNQNLSYFIGVDATVTNGNRFLAGDRNLSIDGKMAPSGLLELTASQTVGWTKDIHQHAGNIALADGSVQQTSEPALRRALAATGVATNRLVIP